MKNNLHSIIASLIAHVVLLAVLSLVVLSIEPRAEEFETSFTFRDQAAIEAVVFNEIELPEIHNASAAPVASTSAMLPAKNVELAVELKDKKAKETVVTETQPTRGAISEVAKIQERVARAGGKTGEVQFSLSWKDFNDLDLHVVTPDGFRIYFGNRVSSSKGELDVDMNVSPESRRPVENVRWLNTPKTGRYTVIVHWFRMHDRKRAVPFSLVRKLSDDTKLIRGSIRLSSGFKVYRFQYIRPEITSQSERQELEQEMEQRQRDEEREASLQLKNAVRDNNKRMIRRVALRYPHTDAGLEALLLLPGEKQK